MRFVARMSRILRSGGRQTLYHANLFAFAEKVVDAVFATKPFQRCFYQRIFDNQVKGVEMSLLTNSIS